MIDNTKQTLTREDVENMFVAQPNWSYIAELWVVDYSKLISCFLEDNIEQCYG